MKTTIANITVAFVLSAASIANASTGNFFEGYGILTILFIGFMILVVMFQALPAIIEFTGFFKGLFSSSKKKTLTKE